MALGFASTLAPQAYNPCMRRPAKFTVIGVATDVVSSKFFDHLPSSFSHRLTFPRFRFKRNQFDQFSAEYRLFVSRLLLLSKFIESRQLTFPFPLSLAPFLGEHRDRGLRNPIRGSISRERRPRIGTSPNERRNLESFVSRIPLRVPPSRAFLERVVAKQLRASMFISK